jgi:hypothetical protein
MTIGRERATRAYAQGADGGEITNFRIVMQSWAFKDREDDDFNRRAVKSQANRGESLEHIYNLLLLLEQRT